MNREINNLEKQLRAKVVERYLHNIGQDRCVCFTCGNASKQLMEVGLNVIEVINPVKWWKYWEIQHKYRCFDATSGHLPIPMMHDIAMLLRWHLGTFCEGEIEEQEIACGSGETFVCLKMAFPKAKLKPIYNLDEATKYNAQAPLNNLVISLL